VRRRWRTKNGLTVPTAEAVAEALETVPPEAPWTWAALRILPAVRGDRIQMLDEDLEGLAFRSIDDFPTLVMPPGVEVTMLVDLGVAGMTVSQVDLDRWEKRIEDLVAPAMANLRRAIGTSRASTYADEHDGLSVRMLRGWPSWGASLLLSLDDLTRIFGAHDQLFVAPYACNLISLPDDADLEHAADIVDLFGFLNPTSLLLNMPAFRLRNGELTTEPLPGVATAPDFEEDWLASVD